MPRRTAADVRAELGAHLQVRHERRLLDGPSGEGHHWAVNELFGTPDQPKLPEVMTKEDADESLKTLVSMERLQAAAGPADLAGHGLYRKHCADCHGVTGNGRGPTAAIINPYPRDYRSGIFKFKTTERGAKPTREDIARSIRLGIAGTAMRPIEGLSEEGVQALTDYVIYLSIRGEVERTTIDTGVMDLNLEEIGSSTQRKRTRQ